MEFEWKKFPRIHHIAALQQSPRVHEQNGRPSTNVLLTSHLCLYLQKDFQQDVGHSSDLDQKRSAILFTSIHHKENGTETLN